MLIVNLWVGISTAMVVILLIVFMRFRNLFKVVQPNEEELKEEVRGRIRPVAAIFIAELLFGVAAGVVQYLPPSWGARALTVPLLFAGQVVLFLYALRVWWELEGIFEGVVYRFVMRMCRKLKEQLKR